MELAAGSDSLTAEICAARGDHGMAAILFDTAFEAAPSAALFARLWSEVLASSEGGTDLAESLLPEEIRRHRSLFDSAEEAHLLWALCLETSLTDLTDSLGSVIGDRYPGTEAAADVAGSIFYDMVYPVWSDDSAKVEVLKQYLIDYGHCSDLWRSRAFMYLVDAMRSLPDSTIWMEAVEDRVDMCPGDPQPFAIAASLLLDDGEPDHALILELTGEGLRLAGQDWRPAGLGDAEWELVHDPVRNSLLLSRCRALHLMGSDSLARCLLEPLLEPSLYPIDDYHTSAGAWRAAAEIELSLTGDTSSALGMFLRSAIEGDVIDRQASRSLERMLELARLEREDAGSWSRNSMNRNDIPAFEDATGMLGPDSLLAGSRVSWVDFDSDGYPDLMTGSRLYINRGGSSFVEVSERCGLTGPVVRGIRGGVWGDLDRDGDMDLVTCGNPVRVLINDDGVLGDSTLSKGVRICGRQSAEGLALLDWNADGYPDLYVASYEKPGQLGTGTPDLFFLGGPGGFRSVEDSLGMIPFLERDLCGRGVSPCDFDRDGDMDIFVSDYRLQENLLWVNTDSGAVNAALELGIAGTDNEGWWGHTIGSCWGDWNGDGEWDIFCANLAHPRYIDFSDRSELLTRTGPDGPFVDRRADAGIRYEETHSCPVWGDFDNDGLLDLYITSVYPDRRSFLYRGVGSRGFEDVIFLSGSRIHNGWGVATADFDRDGRLDLAVGSPEGPRLLRNVGPEGSWIETGLDPGRLPSGCVLGCVVELVQGDRVFVRQVEGGSGTTCQSEQVLHFGLPCDEPCEWRLFVPGFEGAFTSGRGMAPGRLYTLP